MQQAEVSGQGLDSAVYMVNISLSSNLLDRYRYSRV